MKNLVEAALFVATNPVSIEDLHKATGLPMDEIKKMVEALMKDYQVHEGGLEVRSIGREHYVMQAKDEYSEVLKDFVKPIMGREVLKTLSYIALKQPTIQSEVVKARGYLTYEHVKELTRHEFIESEPMGRSKLLTTTQKFADYFSLTPDMGELKKELGKRLKKLGEIEVILKPPTDQEEDD